MKKILFTSLLFYLSSILFSPICLAADTAYVWLQESKVNLWQANGSLTPGTYVPANPSLCGTKPTGAGFTCYANTNKTTTFSADSGLPMIINPTDQLQIKIPFMDLGNITCEGSLAEKNQVCQIPWLANYINGIYNYLLGIAGLLATIVMMYGGLRWLASAGNPQAISDAKAWITGAVFGLILLFSTYIILNTVNPELTNLKSITLGTISKDIEKLADTRLGGEAEQFKSMECPSTAELQVGTQVYATGYYKPPYGTDIKSLCMIAMNCSCPAGQQSAPANCDQFFPKYKNYRPCNSFPSSTNYCNKTSSGSNPKAGDIAVPSCIPAGTKLCINGTRNVTAADSGGGIKGKRIDIWSQSLSDTISNSGTVTLKSGACN
jgi:3D (Asp-Asp-Asp) domain-containing protein